MEQQELQNLPVKVRFYPDVRKTPPVTGYHPHVVAEGTQEYLGIRFVIPEPVPLGCEFTCEVTLMYAHVDYSALRPGVKFLIKEGPHTVGEGAVLDMI